MIQTQQQETDQDKLYPETEYFGQNEHDVYKRTWPDGIPERLPLEPSLKLRNHSPTGFSWHYLGSGPSQLALALLLDATSDPEKALDYYQEFKQQFISSWEDGWIFFRTDILGWLKQMEARELRERQEKN